MGRIVSRFLRREKREVFDAEVRLRGYDPQYRRFFDRKEAKEWVKATEADLRRGKCTNVGEARRHTVADAIDRYLTIYLRQYPHRLKKHTQLLDWWKGKIGHMRLSELTPAVISGLRDHLAGETTCRKAMRSGATVNRYLAALSKVLTLCVREWCWLDVSPMPKVGKLKEGRGRTRFLAIEEIRRLMEACRVSRNKMLYPVVTIALATGMRYSEITTLQWDQIDLDKGYIHLYKTKNGEERTVPIPDSVVELLKSLQTASREALVFPPVRRIGNARGLVQLRSSFDSALKKANIEGVTFHTLRHTAASHFAMQGANTSALMSLLGHKTHCQSKRYTHFADSYLKEIVQTSTRTLFNDNSK
jgi:integrase